MSKVASAETQLRLAKRHIAASARELARLREEVHTYRTLAFKSDEAANEWKKRFDALLKALPGKK